MSASLGLVAYDDEESSSPPAPVSARRLAVDEVHTRDGGASNGLTVSKTSSASSLPSSAGVHFSRRPAVPASASRCTDADDPMRGTAESTTTAEGVKSTAGELTAATRHSRLDALGVEQVDDAGVEPAVAERFARYLAVSRDGSNFTASLRSRKDFRNPCILDKVIARFGIDPLGETLARSPEQGGGERAGQRH